MNAEDSRCTNRAMGQTVTCHEHDGRAGAEPDEDQAHGIDNVCKSKMSRPAAGTYDELALTAKISKKERIVFLSILVNAYWKEVE